MLIRNTGVKAKNIYFDKIFPRPNPIPQPYLSHTLFKSRVFLLVIRSACPPNLKNQFVHLTLSDLQGHFLFTFEMHFSNLLNVCSVSSRIFF